jgi:hypothetical protein
VSSTNGKGKAAQDNYPTPEWCVNDLMNHLVLDGTETFLEPCRGLEKRIYDKVDLSEEQKYFAELDEGIDYLATDFGIGSMDLIITNPPFTLTVEFLTKSMDELSEFGTLVYLQRMNFLGSKKRSLFFKELKMPNKTAIIVPRPSFVKGGNDSCEYAWMIWDRGFRFPTLDVGLNRMERGELN